MTTDSAHQLDRGAPVDHPRPEPTPPGQVAVAHVGDYVAAQAIVDQLSDARLPVQGVRIVGHDMHSVEVVTGRLTTLKAAGLGALSGVWMGLFVGLLLGIFAIIGWVAIVLTAVLFGAVFGAVAGAVGHALTRGRRDFSSVQAIEATRYEVLVPGDLAAQARTLLGTTEVGGGR